MSGSEDLQFVPGSEFTMQWDIKNLSFFGAKENNCLKSKTIVVPTLDNTEWYLKLLSLGPSEKSIMCFLCRTDVGPDNIKVFYCISGDSSYGVEFQTFGKESSSAMPGVINQEKFISNVKSGLHKDVLHIKCRLWKHVGGNADSETQTTLFGPYPVSISMITEIEIEDRSVFYEIKGFSSRPDNEMVSIGLASAALGGVNLVLRLWTDGQTLRVIIREHEQMARHQLFVLNCNIHFLDIFKKRRLLFSGRGIFNSKMDGSDKTWNFPLSMLKKEFMEKKELYLPNDVLLLHCKVEVAGTFSVYKMESTIYDTSDAQTSNHNFQWGMYLDHVYNSHHVLFRLLAILVVILSVLPHLFFNNAV